jgi:hypothetical protein
VGDSSLKYVVEVELQRTGDVLSGAGIKSLTSEAEKATSVAKTLAAGYLEVGKNINEAFIGGMDAMTKFGGIAVTAGFGLIAHQGLQLQSQMESTKMSIAAIFNAAGTVGDIGAGIDLSEKVVGQMRKAAADLPGEFSDLVGIYRTILTSSLEKGLAPDAVLTLSKRAMAAGAAMGLHSQMTGRELAMALDGRVGSHNVLATRLGITGDEAEKFRALDQDKRVEYLQAKFAKFDGAVKAFGNTWDAISSTAVDNWKTFLGETTFPLFEKLKEAGKEFNNWFSANEGTIKGWGVVIGTHLANAFEEGKRIVQTYWPLFADFLEAAWHRTKSFFEEWYPEIKKVGGYLAEALKDSEGTLDKLIFALKLYAGIKAGGALFGAGNSLLGPIMSAGAKVGAAGFLQPMGSALAAGSGAAGAAAGAGEAAAGSGMAALTSQAAGAAAALGLLVVSAWTMSQLVELHSEYGAAVKETTEIEWRTANMAARNMSEWDEVKKAGINSQMFNDAVAEANKNVSFFDEAIYAAKLGLEWFTEGLYKAGPSPDDANFQRFSSALQHVQYVEDQQKDQLALANDALRQMTLATVASNQEKKPEKKKTPEAGNTTIIINQTISSNQSVGQIARRAAEFIVDGIAKGSASRRAPNFSKRT